MSSPEPSLSLDIRQPRSFSTPLARITRSCAASVYLWKRQNTAREWLVFTREAGFTTCQSYCCELPGQASHRFQSRQEKREPRRNRKATPFQFSDGSCIRIWRYLTGTDQSKSHPSFWVPSFTSFQKNIKTFALTNLLSRSSLKKTKGPK